MEIVLGAGRGTAASRAGWPWIAAGAAALALIGTAVALDVAAGGGASLLEEFPGVATVAFGSLGILLAVRRPGHLVGRLIVLIAVLNAFAQLTGVWKDTALPGAGIAWWLATWAWVPGYLLMPAVLLLLVPDGRLPSPRWRPVLTAGIAGVVLSALGWALTPYDLFDVPVSGQNPFATTVGPPMSSVGAGLALIGVGGGLASLVVRFRRSRGVERQQVKWLLVGAAGAIAVLAVAAGLGYERGAPLIALGTVLLPAGIVLAVLRHRLWDVDLVINRSLVYGLLTICVLATYVVAVTVLGGVLGRTTGAPLVATAVVALGVQPVRDRLQRWANGLLYGDRDDPGAALARLAAGLDGPSLDDAAAAIARALRLPAVAIESRGEVRARAGEPADATDGVPLLHRDATVGRLLASPRADSAALDERDLRVLRDVAPHLAVAVRAEQLTEDLQRSREQLVVSREEERRRMRRDLHDDLAPTLAAVALRLDAAEQDELARVVRSAVRSVRSIVEDLRPPALDELGLEGAIRERARHLAHPVEVHAAGLPPLPAATEVAVYRIAAEALANVAAHAGADRTEVRVHWHDGAVELTVADDGVGLRPGGRRGVGLGSMRERAEELGGTLDLRTPPGGGTVVMARLPAAPAAGADTSGGTPPGTPEASR